MLTFPELKATPGIRSELDSVGFPAVLKYLRDRGIPESLIDDLGFQILPASEVIRRSRGSASMDDRLAVIMPHFNVQGDYIDWWSARLVETGLRPVVASFAALVPHKRGKMYCPPSEPPHAYLPPILDWRTLERNDRIYIHESVIKAVNGARLGRWSVGLNGVWGWGSKKHGLGLVQELKDLPWRALQLRPTIVFDSNADDNWDVQAAISQLAAKIYEITDQRADHILLPRNAAGAHQGFDDYCVEVGDEAAKLYLDGEGVEVEVSGMQLLKIKLNSEVVVVRSLGRIANQATGSLMNLQSFVAVNYAHYVAEVEDKWVNVPKAWLADERRASVEGITYAPGRPKLWDDNLNLWRGMGLEPSGGPVTLWLEALERGIADPAIREWVIQWLAYPLQNLGEKLHSYIHFWGPGGSGKQAVIYPLMRIYGHENAIVVKRSNIASNFNSIYTNKQFINVDEVHRADSRLGGDETVNNTLKSLVTDPYTVVNAKGQPEYRVPNVAQIVTTSNYPDSIKLDDDDRRCAVIHFGDRDNLASKGWWKGYYDWINADGASAVYAYLLAVDMAGFDPKGDAPITEDKHEMIRAGQRVDMQWVNDLWADPSGVLPAIYESRAVMTNDELAQLCYGEEIGGATSGRKAALGMRMHAAGFKKLVVKIGGKATRVWIIRRRGEEWGVEAIRHNLKINGFPGV